MVNSLSQVQFKQNLSTGTYIFLFLLSVLGSWLGSYFKAKGKNFANKEDFNELKIQLANNTAVVEKIKTDLSHKSWISQQTWIKKQEAYEAIFDCLFHVKKYVSHSKSEYYEWEYYNHHYPELAYEIDDEYSIRIWEHEKEEYLKKSQDPETKAEAEKIKTKYDESFAKLFHIIEVKSIYLDEKVGNIINELKKELSTTQEYEDWDEHFFRQAKEVKSTETKLKRISIEELKIKT